MNHDHVVGAAARSVTRNGAGFDVRLRAVEDVVREIKADVKSFGDRLRAVEGDTREIKARLRHVATRAWVLGGILAGMGVAAGIGVTLARFFLAQ